MRVLMINKYLYPRAGAEVYMINLSKMLLEKGHQVAFWGMEHPENTSIEACYEIPLIEFGEHATRKEKILGLSAAVYNTLFKAQKKHLKRAIKIFNPEIIHAHNVYNQLSPDLLCEISNHIPTLMTAHDYYLACPSYNLYTNGNICKRCIKGSLYSCVKYRCVQDSVLKSGLAALSAYRHRKKNSYEKAYRHIIAPSQFMKNILLETGVAEEKLSVIHNFMDLKEYKRDLGRNILYVGRLSKEKGVETLLKGYAKLKSPKPKLVIAGSGPQEQLLRNIAVNLALKDLTWLGKISPNRVREEMDKSLCVIVPSEWYENCSMTILEALSRGRAVVTCDIGGNGELVQEDYNGALFTLKDSSSLAKTLESLLENKKNLLRMGENGRKSVLRSFSSEGHLRKILNIYETLVTEKQDAV